MHDGTLVSVRLCPEEGRLSELLKLPEDIRQSKRHLKVAAAANPDNGPLRKSYPGFSAKSFFGGKVTNEFNDFLAELKEEGEEEDKSSK